MTIRLNGKQLKNLKVFVYYNLHKSVWSVKAMEGEHKGLVVAHVKQIGLMECSPKVSQKGRERVLKEKRKNVHAGLTGEILWIDGAPVDVTGKRGITYNPYKEPHFVYTDTLDEFKGNSYTVLKDKTVWEIVA